MTRLVVIDAGPLIHLEQADFLSLLKLTGEVLVPKTVLDVLEDGPTDLSDLEFSVERADIDTDSAYPHLDPGETVVILACTDRGRPYLLTTWMRESQQTKMGSKSTVRWV
jgi:hypothetical protein